MPEPIKDRLARIRAQQAASPRLTPEQIKEAIERHFAAHEDHPWHAVGRCVYCGPCGVRLYQGTMPSDHEVWRPPPRRTRADEMLALRKERYGI